MRQRGARLLGIVTIYLGEIRKCGLPQVSSLCRNKTREGRSPGRGAPSLSKGVSGLSPSVPGRCPFSPRNLTIFWVSRGIALPPFVAFAETKTREGRSPGRANTSNYLLSENKHLMANTYTQLHIQYVFAVKGRENMIPRQHKEQVHQYMNGLLVNRKHKLLRVNCMPDHCHLFVGLHPALSA